MLSGWFFFSSRRRHTRCSRDWSSDVCSSDILFFKQLVAKSGPRRIENDADVFRIVVFDQALENISKKKRNVRGRAVGAGQPLRHGRKKCPINVCHRVHKEEFLRSGSHPREYSKGRGRGREEQHLLLSGMRDPHQFGGCRWSTCRSEEHTSELQSRLHLVCRLLLEKKKK